MTLEKALKKSAGVRRTFAERDPNREEHLRHALVLEDIARNAGIHAAGVVIGDSRSSNSSRSSARKATSSHAVRMKPVGKLGLLKMDFLGLKTLTVIARRAWRW